MDLSIFNLKRYFITNTPNNSTATSSVSSLTPANRASSGSSSNPAQFNLSSLNGTNGFVLNGVTAGDHSGVSVSAAGDVNGDGISDMIIGAPDASALGRSYAGVSYVVFGRNGTVVWPASVALGNLNGTDGFVLDGMTMGDASGFSVSAAGDVNGDSIDDMIIGAPNAPGWNDTGASYIVFGRGSTILWPASVALGNLNGTDGCVLNGVAMGDASGFSVSVAGDVNGDDIDDMIIGAPQASGNSGGNHTGASYVVFGRNGTVVWPASVALGNLNGTDGFVLNGVASGDSTGRAVSTAGDINGDGIDDMIIGASGAPAGSKVGASYVVFGRNGNTLWPASIALGNLNGTDGFVLNGVASNDESGFSVGTAGDINGDGIDDMIIGAPQASGPGKIKVGASYAVFGRNGTTLWPASIALGNLNGTDGFVLNGVANSFDDSGTSVSTVGDVNDDGIDDMIIGAPYAPGGIQVGASYVVFGRNGTTLWPASVALGNLNGTDGFVLNGVGKSDFSGNSVSGAGDINGDGINDIMVGAPNAPGRNATGASYIVFGRHLSPEPPLNTAIIIGIIVGGILGIIALGLFVYAAYRSIQKIKNKRSEVELKELIDRNEIQEELHTFLQQIQQLESLINELRMAATTETEQKIDEWMYDLILNHKQQAESFLTQNTIQRRQLKILIKDVIVFVNDVKNLNIVQDTAKLEILKISLQQYLKQPYLKKVKNLRVPMEDTPLLLGNKV